VSGASAVGVRSWSSRFTVRQPRGSLDFDSTEQLSPDPQVGLVGLELSEAGAKMIRQRFDRCAAPRVKLLCAYAGSRSVQVMGVPRSAAETLGEVLAAAATAGESGGAGVLGVPPG